MLDIAIGVPLEKAFRCDGHFWLKAIKLHMFKCFDCVSAVYHYDTFDTKRDAKKWREFCTQTNSRIPVAIPYISW